MDFLLVCLENAEQVWHFYKKTQLFPTKFTMYLNSSTQMFPKIWGASSGRPRSRWRSRNQTKCLASCESEIFLKKTAKSTRITHPFIGPPPRRRRSLCRATNSTPRTILFPTRISEETSYGSCRRRPCSLGMTPIGPGCRSGSTATYSATPSERNSQAVF